MAIQPLTMGAISPSIGGNSTLAAAQTTAQDAEFQRVLQDVQRKQAANQGVHHVVNEAATSKQDKELKKACKGFEAMFLAMMYRQMRETVPKDTLFGESNAMNIFKDYRDTEMMKQVADSGGIGLADMLYKQLSPQIAAQDKAAAEGAAKAAKAQKQGIS